MDENAYQQVPGPALYNGPEGPNCWGSIRAKCLMSPMCVGEQRLLTSPTRTRSPHSPTDAESSMWIYTVESWTPLWLSINSKPIFILRTFCPVPTPRSEIGQFTSAGHAGESVRWRVLGT